MTTTRRNKRAAAKSNGKAPTKAAKKELVKLTEVQLDKFNAIQQKELAFQNELVAVRAAKTDLMEVILDANGYTKQKLSKVKNITLTENKEFEITV